MNCNQFVAPRVCFGSVVQVIELKLNPRAIIVLFASVLLEYPAREDVNPILRGGGSLREASGIGGTTLR